MERTHPPNAVEALDSVLAQPSYAAQALLVTARVLDMHPTQALGPTVLDEALRTGLRAVLGQLPATVRADARRIAFASLPEASASDTHAEYAIRLRAAAKGL